MVDFQLVRGWVSVLVSRWFVIGDRLARAWVSLVCGWDSGWSVISRFPVGPGLASGWSLLGFRLVPGRFPVGFRRVSGCFVGGLRSTRGWFPVGPWLACGSFPFSRW